MGIAVRFGLVTSIVLTIVFWKLLHSHYWPVFAGMSSLLLIATAFTTGPTPHGHRKLSRSLNGALRSIEDGATDNHGHASWMAIEDALKAFPGPSPVHGGVVVGEAYRVDQDKVAGKPFNPQDKSTWGKGGRAKLLIDPCRTGPTHSLFFAGSGGYKTTAAVSTVLTWTGNSVVLDPSCEVGPMVRDALESQGKSVYFLDPERPDDAKTWGFNALDWIDVRHELAEMHIHTVVGWIFGETSGNESEETMFFRKAGKDLVVCLMAHMLWDDTATAPKNLSTLRVGVSTPQTEMRKLLKGISVSSKSRMARHLASSLMEIVEETFSGMYANANQGTSWLSVKSLANLVSGDAFRTSDLVDGSITVFVQIPLPALMATPGIGRVIIGALLNAVYEADGEVAGRILFLLDEVSRLGRMKVLEAARDVGRKYGLTLQLLYQSVGQLETQWGRDGKRAWYDGVSWRGYAAVQDLETAKELSALCGNRGVMAYSEGENSGRQNPLMSMMGGSKSKGQNTNVHEIRRPLILPEEILQDMRGDDMIVVPRGSKPIRCGRAISFRRPEMVAQIEASRFNNKAA